MAMREKAEILQEVEKHIIESRKLGIGADKLNYETGYVEALQWVLGIGVTI